MLVSSFQDLLIVGFMGLGFQELMIVGIVAVLLFGKRLPEVAKSLGHTYREFRKGLTDIQSSFDYSDSHSSPKPYVSTKRYSDDFDDYDEPTAPKFVPPPQEPSRESIPSGEISKPVSEK